MHHIKISIFTDKEINVNDWLRGCTTTSSALPDICATTCIWYSLNNNKLICSDTLHQRGEHVVILLHQNGVHSRITTENMLLAANRHVIQSHNAKRPVSLVLCGLGVEARELEWKKQICFSTSGQPPLIQLIIVIFVTAVVQNHPRLAHVLKHIMQKVSRFK